MEKIEKIEALILHEHRANRIARDLHILLNDSKILQDEIPIDSETRQEMLNACLKVGTIKYDIRERIEEIKREVISNAPTTNKEQ